MNAITCRPRLGGSKPRDAVGLYGALAQPRLAPILSVTRSDDTCFKTTSSPSTEGGFQQLVPAKVVMLSDTDPDAPGTNRPGDRAHHEMAGEVLERRTLEITGHRHLADVHQAGNHDEKSEPCRAQFGQQAQGRSCARAGERS